MGQDVKGGSSGKDRRAHARYDTSFEVDYGDGENFLFAYIQNISAMGIFIRTDDPLPIGTELELRFGKKSDAKLELAGRVAWVNPYRPGGPNLNPGMGVEFHALTKAQREQVVELVRTIAYLQDE